MAPPALAGLALPARIVFDLYTLLPSLNTAVAVRPVLFTVLSYLTMLRPASLLSVRGMRVSAGLLQYKPLHWKTRCLTEAEAPVLQVPVVGLSFVHRAVVLGLRPCLILRVTRQTAVRMDSD